MIAEHSLVTTMEEGAARDAALALLESMGFRAHPPGPDAWLLASRPGVSRPIAANELGFTVRGAFDRQRLSFAVADSGMVARSFALSRATPPPRVTVLLTVMLTALERRLIDGVDTAAATAEWRALESELADEAKRHRRRRLWIACGVVTGVIGLVVLLVSLANLLS